MDINSTLQCYLMNIVQYRIIVLLVNIIDMLLPFNKHNGLIKSSNIDKRFQE